MDDEGLCICRIKTIGISKPKASTQWILKSETLTFYCDSAGPYKGAQYSIQHVQSPPYLGIFLRDGLDGVHKVVGGLIGTIVSPAPQL